MTRLLPSALGLLAALSVALAPRPALAEATVADVRIEGNRRVEVDAIRNAISERKGAPYDSRKIRADVRALMKLGFFSDVTVEREGTPEAPVLVYRVTERPAIRQWHAEGNEELSKKDLEETVTLKPGQVLDPAAVQKDVKKIQDKYVDKGYYLAEVSSRLEEKPDNQVDVVFVINEHAKVQVKEVHFLGNGHVPGEDLRKVMQTREGGLLSFLSGAGTYREEALQRDVQAIQALYLDRGYVTVKVGTPAVALSPDKRFIYVGISIEEGEQYTIGKIAFEGELLEQEPKLRKLLKTRTGEIFSRSEVAADLFAIGDVYKDLGHAYANVTPLTATDPKTRIVDITFDVQPGKVVSFDRIDVVGNDKTRDKVIRRELRIYEGERFSGTGLRTSRQRVNALGFFETVDITTKPSGDDKVIAVVEVKERPTGTFQIGAGFSSYENFILTGQISQQNFFGWGQTLSLQVQWSKIRQLYQIQFVEPHFLDTRWTFAFDVYRSESIYTTFTRRSTGGSVTWGYELSGLAPWWSFASRLEDVRLFATYTNERVDVAAAEAVTTAQSQFKSGTTSSLRLSLQWDKRDNRLFPTAGFFIAASSEIAPPLLAPRSIFGSDVNLFTRYSFDARYYHPVWRRIVARAKLTLGLIRDWDADHPVPISELFYVGGINSVRGYRYLSIAPRRDVLLAPLGPDRPTHELSVGGDKQAVVNLELEFPIFPEAQIRGVVFSDFGNAFPRGKYSDPAVSLSMYKSVGFGVRWFSPIGPLRFEWGFPLNRRKDRVTGAYIDEPVDFQFTIGNFF